MTTPIIPAMDHDTDALTARAQFEQYCAAHAEADPSASLMDADDGARQGGYAAGSEDYYLAAMESARIRVQNSDER